VPLVAGVVGVVLPVIFNRQVEFLLVLFGVVVWFLWHERLAVRSMFTQPIARWLVSGLVVAVTAFPVVVQYSESTIASERNFYGTLKVVERDTVYGGETHTVRAIMNGQIVHGLEPVDRVGALPATSYYAERSGLDFAIRSFTERGESPQVAVVGAGVGITSAYCEDVQRLDYIEINPLVIELGKEYFNYFDQCPEKTSIYINDGRRYFTELDEQVYDVIVIDAFTDDAIPAHLLTTEAINDAYLPHLAPDGIIAFHISNQYLNLVKPISGVTAGLSDHELVLVETTEALDLFQYPSVWVLLTPPTVARILVDKHPEISSIEEKGLRWTDDRYSVLQALSLSGSSAWETYVRRVKTVFGEWL